MIVNIFAIFLGGGIGAVLRYFLTELCRNLFSFSMVGTFSSNLIGCFLIGYVFGIIFNKTDLIPQALKLFVTVGFLGGLTTFSTFCFEIFDLIKNDKFFIGLLYLVISCIMAIMLTCVGYYLAIRR